ncbi:hypothetical protein CEXT_632331 [Caerostris extrusa]|uniref:Uncharacterized protein n=1 Tax=Caerostris extrusa TaxID=172846 RepID=A0AAV4Y6L0_CAEEX|nr:hypothetical protein CEXT_632331 [Caerostris extrusa]
MMEPRCYHAVCQVGTFVYITGGYCPLQRKRRGRCLPPPVHSQAGPEYHSLEEVRGHEGCACISRHGSVRQPPVYIRWAGFLRQHPCNAVYSSAAGQCGSLCQLLAYLSCSSSQDTIWVVGGSRLSKESSHTPLVSCAIVWHLQLNIRPHKWKILTSLSSPTHASSVALSGRDLYVFGGMQSETMKVTNKVEIIDIGTGIVRSGIRMPALLTGSSSVFLPKMASDANIRRNVKSLICRREAVPKLHTYEKSRLPRSSGTTSASKVLMCKRGSFSRSIDLIMCHLPQKQNPQKTSSLYRRKEEKTDYTSYQPFKKPPFLSYSAPQRIDILKAKSGQSLDRVRSSEKPESPNNSSPFLFTTTHHESAVISEGSPWLASPFCHNPRSSSESRKKEYKGFHAGCRQTVKTELYMENWKWKPIAEGYLEPNVDSNPGILLNDDDFPFFVPELNENSFLKTQLYGRRQVRLSKLVLVDGKKKCCVLLVYKLAG